ncbi:MAG: DNA cytosine methyltransferase [Flexilinea sp.]|nr:DNA cytosine methyltransferase [Flexilinea sp.]
MRHYGDITQLHGDKLEPVDLIVGGSPCFPAGTLVLTEHGYLPIEDVREGMTVLTHLGRWKTVTATGHTVGKTVVLKGNHYGLECTPNHPIYSANKELSVKDWTPAKDMLKRFWAIPNRANPIPSQAMAVSSEYELSDSGIVPGWVFGMPEEYKTKLILNFIKTYCRQKRNQSAIYRFTTNNKQFAESIRLLAEMCGYSMSIRKSKKDLYIIEIDDEKINDHLKDDLHGWYRVRSVTPTNEIKTVYNLTVEDDNSYIADGIVVHNCQDLSSAGKRAGLAGERSGLFMEMIRLIKEMRNATNNEQPRYALWENVCFDADTLITCEDGYKRIADVRIGDKVKTQSGRYLPVEKTYKNKNCEVLRLRVSGGEDLLVTPNHPFLAREKKYINNDKKFGRTISEPKWIPASELTANHLIAYRIDIPKLPENFLTKTEAWTLGRWIADGSVDLSKSNPRIFISSGLKKVNETREKLSELPYDIHENKPHATAINFTFTSREFYSLIAGVGIKAGNKRMPPFVFDLPFSLQKIVLEGYLSGDGYERMRGNNTEISAGTASRELAYGIARLIRNVYRVNANISRRKMKNGNIGGRIIRANYPCYIVSASKTKAGTATSTPGFVDDDIVWQPLKEIRKETKKINVYNLSVLEDNTYAANDIVVHNCGAFSSNDGRDFSAVLTEFARIVEPDTPDVPVPEEGWPKSGILLGSDWSISWRTHDAQYWGKTVRDSRTGDVLEMGTPQRRRRIALIADFRGKSAYEILLESEGLCGDIKTGGETWEGAPTETGGSPDYPIEGVGCDLHHGVITGDVTATLTANTGTSATHMGPTVMCDEATTIYGEQVTPTLVSGYDRRTGNTQDIIPINMMIALRDSKDGDKTGMGVGEPGDPQFTITATHHHAVFCLNDQGGQVMNVSRDVSGTLRAEEHGHQPIIMKSNDYKEDRDPVICIQGNAIDRSETAGCNGKGWTEDVCYTLNTIDRPAVFDSQIYHGCKEFEDGVSQTVNAQYGTGGNNMPFVVETYSMDAYDKWTDNEVGTTLRASGGMYGGGSESIVVSSKGEEEQAASCQKITHNAVRRLTPVECERLQGFPSGWTDIPGATDSKRYKALGNSICLPFWEWLAHRFVKMGNVKTIGSLFDGISGFCLVFKRAGAETRWNSEIESFCQEVCKYHFGDEETGEEGDVEQYLNKGRDNE